MEDYYDILARACLMLQTPEALLRTLTTYSRQHPDLPFSRDKNWKARQEAAIRRGIPPIFLNMQVKSGSAFFSHAIQKIFNVPLIRMGYQIFEDLDIEDWVQIFARGGATCHHHKPYADTRCQLYHKHGINRMVLLLRDPRQTMLSIIHHNRRMQQDDDATINQRRLRQLMEHRKTRDIELSTEQAIDRALKGPFQQRVQWVDDWLVNVNRCPLDILILDHQDIVDDLKACLGKIADFFDIPSDAYDMAALDGFTAVPKQHHFRQGRNEEWKEVLSGSQRALANAQMTPALLGRYGP